MQANLKEIDYMLTHLFNLVGLNSSVHSSHFPFLMYFEKGEQFHDLISQRMADLVHCTAAIRLLKLYTESVYRSQTPATNIQAIPILAFMFCQGTYSYDVMREVRSAVYCVVIIKGGRNPPSCTI